MITCPACKYQKGYGWIEETGYCEVNSTEESFIEISGTFLVENSGWHGGKHQVHLYACPKCSCVTLVD